MDKNCSKNKHFCKKIASIIGVLWLMGCGAGANPTLNQVAKIMRPPQQYVKGIDDLPLYSGFVPSKTGNVVYDTERGRIVEAMYEKHAANVEEVQQFYHKALPQLGWRRFDEEHYEREGESMQIMVSEDSKGKVVLRFYVTPKVSSS